MKRILVFVDWYLPGFKAGGPIRSVANMVSSLKQHYQFFILCFDTDYLEENPYPNIKPMEWNQLSENEQVYYIPKRKLSYNLLKKLLKSMDFDIVYINGAYSFYFSILPIFLSKLLKINTIIVAPRGMLSGQGFSSKNFRKKLFIGIVKLFGFYKNITIHSTSSMEKDDIQLLKLRPLKIEVIPNLPPSIELNNSARREKTKGELRMVSIARISPEKNTLFALQCLANYQYNGKITYHLYGPVYDKPYWLECMKLISNLPNNIEVVYKGELNNNLVQSALQNYHFLFLPTKGENFGHSILESFMTGCPVIISNTTPWRNLGEKNLGWDFDLKTELFAEVIQKALDFDNQIYQSYSSSCIEYAKGITENPEIKEGYLKLFG